MRFSVGLAAELLRRHFASRFSSVGDPVSLGPDEKVVLNLPLAIRLSRCCVPSGTRCWHIDFFPQDQAYYKVSLGRKWQACNFLHSVWCSLSLPSNTRTLEQESRGEKKKVQGEVLAHREE